MSHQYFMKRTLLFLSILTIAFSSCVKDRVTPVATGPVVLGDRKLIHYWSFNTGTDAASLAIPDSTIGGGTISYTFAGAGYADAVTPGAGNNLRLGKDTGTGLRVRNPFYSWVLHAPTTGYKQPILQFAAQKSNSGPASNTISYTTDGTNYTTVGLSATSVAITTVWTQYSVDFSNIPAVDDNPKFAIKFAISIADTAGGNDRYDNITIDAFKK